MKTIGIVVLLLIAWRAWAGPHFVDEGDMLLAVMETKETPEGIEIRGTGSKTIAPAGLIRTPPDDGGVTYQVTIASNLVPRIIGVYLTCTGTNPVVERVSLRLSPAKDGGLSAEFVARRSPEWNIVVRYKKDSTVVDYLYFHDTKRP
jgi:hypothetical protein